MRGTRGARAVNGQTINRIARISEHVVREIALREEVLGVELHKAALKLGKTPTREQTLEYGKEAQKRVKWLDGDKGGLLYHAAQQILDTHFLSGNPLHRALMLSLLNGVHDHAADSGVKFRNSPADASTRRYDIGLGTNFRELDAEAFELPKERPLRKGANAPDITIGQVAKELHTMGLVGWFKDHPVYIRLTPVGEAAIERWYFIAGRRGLRSELGPVVQFQRKEEAKAEA